MNVTFPIAGMARVLAVGLLCSASLPARANDKFWSYSNCGNSLWVYNCWSSTFGGALDGTGQPKNGDNVYLYNTSATDYTVTFRNSISPIPTLNLLNIDAFGTGAMNLSQTAYDLKTLNENVGILGTGLVEQTGGTHSVTNTLSLGVGAGSFGSFSASNTAKVSAGTLIAGNYGFGVMGITNGADLSTDTVYLAANAGSIGVLTVDGPGSSLVNSGTIYAGHTGVVGTLAVKNGATATSNNAYVGYSAGSTGGITVDGVGSSLTTASTLEVARYGTGSMSVVNGGTVTTNGPGNLGYFAGSNGSVTIDGAGSKLDINSTLRVGHQGTADIQVLNGASFESVTSYIGTSATGSGSVTVSGPGSTWTTPGGNMELGGYGNASLTIENGGSVATGALYMGRYAGSTATLSLSGLNSNLSTSGSLLVGGNLNAAGGTATLEAWDLSSINVNNSLTIWDAGALRLYGGEIHTKHFANRGSMTLSSGLLSVSNGTFNSDSAVTLSIDFYDDGTQMALDLNNVMGNINGALSIGDNVRSGSVGSAAAVMNITNGSVVSSTAGNIGKNAAVNGIGLPAAGNGIVTVDGPGTQWNNSGDLLVAGYGTGDLSITNGADVTSAQGILGQSGNIGVCSSWNLFLGCVSYDYVNSSGSVTVDGSGSSWINSGDLRVGANGDGSLVISQGGVVSNVNAYIGELEYSNGAVTVSGAGSTWNNSGSLYVGGNALGYYRLDDGSGSLAVNDGGTITVADTLKIWGDSVLDLNGGSISTRYFNAVGTFNFNDGLLTVTNGSFRSEDTLNGNLVIDGAVGGHPVLTLDNSSLQKVGGGGILVGYSQTGELNIVNGSAIADGIILGYGAGSTGAVTVDGFSSALDVSGDLLVGFFGVGSLAVTNGATVTAPSLLYMSTGSSVSIDGGTLSVAGNVSGTGTINLDAGTLNVDGNSLAANAFNIGVSGAGSHTQSGGTHTVNSLTLAANIPSTGSYFLNNGNLSVVDEIIGNSGPTGYFNQKAGNHNVANILTLGMNAGSRGVYDLNGTGSLSTGDSRVGIAGNGDFIQRAGSHEVNNALVLGSGSSGNGQYSLTGGTLTVANAEYVGLSGSGSVNQGGGIHTVTGLLSLGENTGSSGSYDLSGSANLMVDEERIGNSGTGSFDHVGGTHTVNNHLYLGYFAGSNGGYTLNGLGNLMASNETIGLSGSGSFFQLNGIHTVSNTLTLGANSGSSGTYQLAGGTLNVDNIANGAGSSTLNYVGGTLNFTGTYIDVDTFRLDAYSGLSKELLLVNGQSLTAGNEIIGRNGNASIVQDGGVHTVGGELVLASETGSNGSYQLSGTGSLSAGSEIIGRQGTGSFSQSGGTHAVSGILTLGFSGSTGSYQLGGTGSLSAGNVLVGSFGAGIFTQDGGDHTVNDTLALASGYGSTGSYFLNDGSLAVGSERIGDYGNGDFTQTGGTHTVSNYLMLGNYLGTTGTFNLNGGTLNVNAIGNGNGTGVFNLDDGILNLTGASMAVDAFRLGTVAGTDGRFTLASGQTLSVRDETIGWFGTGSMTQNGGTHTVSNNLYLGSESGSTGIYLLTGNGSLSAKTEMIGYGGNGSLIQDSGTHTVSSGLYLGFRGGNQGSYHLSDSGSLTSGFVNIGNSGSGNFIQTGGTHTVTNSMTLGGNSGSGHYALSGSGSLSENDLYIGFSRTGSFVQDGGVHTVSNNLTLGRNAGSSGGYDMNGGWLMVNGNLVGGAGTGTFNMTGGRVSVATLNTDISNGGVDFSFTGGTLAVDTVIGDLINAGGTLAPGNSPGVTTINGDYTQTLAGLFSVELGGVGPGEYDVLNVTGIASLGGMLSVDWYDLGGGLFNAALGDSFDILTAETLSGEFDLLTLAMLDNGLAWDVRYLTDVFGTTDILRLNVVSAVPVPAAVWLFASGLLGLVAVARRRTLIDIALKQ